MPQVEMAERWASRIARLTGASQSAVRDRISGAAQIAVLPPSAAMTAPVT
jgi:hypothetical protein